MMLMIAFGRPSSDTRATLFEIPLQRYNIFPVCAIPLKENLCTSFG